MPRADPPVSARSNASKGHTVTGSDDVESQQVLNCMQRHPEAAADAHDRQCAAIALEHRTRVGASYEGPSPERSVTRWRVGTVPFIVRSRFDPVAADSHVAPPAGAVLRRVEEQQHTSLAPATPNS